MSKLNAYEQSKPANIAHNGLRLSRALVLAFTLFFFSAEASGATISEKESPYVRPLVGVWGKVNLRKHLSISLGAQYNHIGVQIKNANYGVDKNNDVEYKINTTTDFIFKKISFPIIVGYDFNIKKIRADFFVGYRPPSYTSGSFTYRYSYVDETGLQDEMYEKKIDPFDYSSLAEGAQRRQKQFLAGAGIYFNRNLYLSFLCAAYNKINFLEQLPPGQPSATGYYHEYSRWDLLLSLKYTLWNPFGSNP